jgi:hypothetical protein
MRHLWTAVIMPEHHTLGDGLPKRSQGGADALADGFQRFAPGPWRGRMDTHTRGRGMIHGNQDRSLPVLVRGGRRHIGSPSVSTC